MYIHNPADCSLGLDTCTAVVRTYLELQPRSRDTACRTSEWLSAKRRTQITPPSLWSPSGSSENRPLSSVHWPVPCQGTLGSMHCSELLTIGQPSPCHSAEVSPLSQSQPSDLPRAWLRYGARTYSLSLSLSVSVCVCPRSLARACMLCCEQLSDDNDVLFNVH